MEELIGMLRTILMDFAEIYTEVFIYSGSNTFYLTEPNVVQVEKVLINDVDITEIESTVYYIFDDIYNSVILKNIALTDGDVIKVIAKKFKFSDQELDSYIRQALLYISAGYKNFDVISTYELYPIPTSEEKKLIVLIASMLAKPDYTEYRLPTVTVRYATKVPLEEKINMLINKYIMFSGIWDYVVLSDDTE